MVSGGVHLYIYHLLLCRLFGGSMGHDWRIVSTKGSRISRRDDHICRTYVRLYGGENLSDAITYLATTWHIHFVWRHLIGWSVYPQFI